jgi:hypothetical protein
MSEDSPECQDAIAELVTALKPFAALLDSLGLEDVSGGTVIRVEVTVQMIKDAQDALKGRDTDH